MKPVSRKGDSRWELSPDDPPVQGRLSRELEIHPILARLLINRGITDSGAASHFLSPSLSGLRQPFGNEALPDIEKAVERVLDAIVRREKITIFGDYDADGISATAILFLFLDRAGAQVEYELPDRIKEGYGLNEEAVRRISSRGSRLLLTVDCGTSDFEEIACARYLGMDVVVLDHHQVEDDSPAALAFVNPQRRDSRFPFPELAGVGVAFYLLIALRQRMRERGMLSPEGHNLREYLDLVALGTIADMMPLREDNRIFAAFGLKELARAERPGIRALREVSGTLGRDTASVGEVGFYLAPRINAVGRLGDGRVGVDLLIARELERSRELARDLDSANRARQREEERILREARAQVRSIREQSGDRPPAIVLANESWHPGVVGVVASKLLDEHYCPVCLISITDGTGRGSGRSVAGISIHQILQKLAPHLISYGGHEMAAGFRIMPEAVNDFVRAFEAEVIQSARIAPQVLEPRVRVDAEIASGELRDLATVGLPLLSPHGIGNPEPVFLGRGLKVKQKRLIRSRHLKMALDWGTEEIQAIGFGMASRHSVQTGEVLDILFHYREDGGSWRRAPGQLPDLLLKDIKPAPGSV